MESRTNIEFILNETVVNLPEIGPGDMLLDHLRLDRRLTGTKEGCAEGDCGACSVLIGRPDRGALRYEPVNACIRPLASCHGCHVVTVEFLHNAHKENGGEDLHPVQRALVDHHASQCGFCTPGFVMALYGLWLTGGTPTREEIEVALQGNLCRCTGYAPIIRAAQNLLNCSDPSTDPLRAGQAEVMGRLDRISTGQRVETEAGAILPASVEDLARVVTERPDATIVAGATDVGLWVTKHLRDIAPAIFVSHLTELKKIEEGDTALTIGAGASYSDLFPVLRRTHPHLVEYWTRIGGWQVRNAGTIGGNIANGSPIGDTPPAFIALGATLGLRRGDVRRELPLEAFFLDYGVQDLAPGEFVETISLPYPRGLNAAYKISKRRDEDISSVAVGLQVEVEDGLVRAARIAFGGMAATAKRAKAAEDALIDGPWTEDGLIRAAEALAQDFTPISDMRASSEYRMQVSKNLLRRFWAEQVT